jgi:hypothetical protein
MMRLDVEGLTNTSKLSEGASMAVGSLMPSPPLGDRRFVVVNLEEEEEVKKKMISLWKKQGKAGEGDWRRELY